MAEQTMSSTQFEHKTIRAPSLKRYRNDSIADRIRLEKVLGVTATNNAALASDNSTTIAYPAGCTIVLFDTENDRQHHIVNVVRRTITAICFSSCGRYLATGECGHQPAVRVWDLYTDTPQSVHPGLESQPQQVAHFAGHTYAICCVAFSPSGKYVVSVGTQHDMIVSVWDWRNNIKIASNKVSTKVKAIAFAENGSYFVTVGNRHVKFWYLDHSKSKVKKAVPLMGRSAILGEQRNNYFCDVACGRGRHADSTYAITRSGLLCEFNNRRLLDKWVELRTTSANCMTISENQIFIGCADAIIRCFDPSTLRYITTLPRTHYLGVDVSRGTHIAHITSPPIDARYPDTIAITYNETNSKLSAIYNDHSIYIWDVCHMERIGKSFSFLYHSACIWGVEMAPVYDTKTHLPDNCFLTCSSDDTIRVWTLDGVRRTNRERDDDDNNSIYRPNIYSNELLKIVYIDNDLNYIKDLDMSSGDAVQRQQRMTSYDGKNGVRCIRVSPDGRHLASGDRSGNIRVHDTKTMTELCKIEAHDAEVLCLEYDATMSVLASASRDRLLHILDVGCDYEFLQTLDDHSSSITAVRFLTANRTSPLQMISCGADKSLIFRTLNESMHRPQFQRRRNVTGKMTLYDMEVDAGQKHILTACQDRNVRVYSVSTGKHTKTFKGATGDDGTLIKTTLDRSGIYLATSCTDKSLSVYDYYTGECMATMCGHSELVTGLRFTNDCKRLISASGDGCIFIWRIPHDMVVTMCARLNQQAMRQGKSVTDSLVSSPSPIPTPSDDQTDIDYRFSVGKLPQWLQKHFTVGDNVDNIMERDTQSSTVTRGRWAQRRTEETMVASTPTYLIGGADDSSLESYPDGGVSRNSPSPPPSASLIRSTAGMTTSTTTSVDMKRSTINVTLARGEQLINSDNATADTGFESSAHDADIDSDNDYRHKPMYYPTNMTTGGAERDYNVTNIDVEELRRSVRKKKLLTNDTLTVTTSNAESDDDDDDVSTPSGENTDRNPMSLLSASWESLDQIATREKYLQNIFDSMDGVGGAASGGGGNGNAMLMDDSKSTSATYDSMNVSLSAKFRTSDVNQAAINAVQQTKSDPEAAKKRDLLNRRIAGMKKKLESVTNTSTSLHPLKNSQSVMDISQQEREKWSTETRTSTASSQAYSDENVPPHDCSATNTTKISTNLRRSCSLSDLKVQKTKDVGNTGRTSAANTNIKTISKTNAWSTKNSSAIRRTRSTTVLNQQSQLSTFFSHNNNNNNNSLMRPTISSTNKLSKKAQIQLRKKQSYSTSNLTALAGGNGGASGSSGGGAGGNETNNDPGASTSDEEIEASARPVVPPRNRSINYDTNNGTVVPPRRHHSHHHHHHSRAAPNQICHVVQQLARAANDMVVMYDGLKAMAALDVDDDMNEIGNGDDVREVINELEDSLQRTRNLLDNLTITIRRSQ